MKELTFEQMETTRGGKFIGVVKGCSEFMGTQVCFCTFYFFWLPVDYYECGGSN